MTRSRCPWTGHRGTTREAPRMPGRHGAAPRLSEPHVAGLPGSEGRAVSPAFVVALGIRRVGADPGHLGGGQRVVAEPDAAA